MVKAEMVNAASRYCERAAKIRENYDAAYENAISKVR
jgi:hypothetical protein